MEKSGSGQMSVSVIIPAANEELFIEKAVRSVLVDDAVQVVVVVNGSKDNTAHKARQAGAHVVLEFSEPLGASLARNKGAEVANGSILLFLDADSILSPNTLPEIRSVFQTEPRAFGACRAKPIEHDVRARLYVAFKNIIHFLRIYDGVYGMIFCPRELFFLAHGFNPNAKVAEFKSFISQLKQRGGRYFFLTSCSISTSMRRFEKNGYLAVIAFWVRFWLSSLATHEKKIAEEYKNL